MDARRDDDARFACTGARAPGARVNVERDEDADIGPARRSVPPGTSKKSSWESNTMFLNARRAMRRDASRRYARGDETREEMRRALCLCRVATTTKRVNLRSASPRRLRTRTSEEERRGRPTRNARIEAFGVETASARALSSHVVPSRAPRARIACHSPSLHHGPTEFAALSAADAATSAAARNAKTAAAVIRRHHPSPGPSQYPAERSSRPTLSPDTAHAAA